jgi:hypothetical protein
MALQEFIGLSLLLLLITLHVAAHADLLLHVLFELLLLHDLPNSLDAVDALPTSLITLNKSDGYIHVHINCVDIVHSFLHGVRLI